VKISDLTSWLSGTDSIYGLEVYVNKQSQEEFRLVQISKKNGSLVSTGFFVFHSLEDLLTLLPTGSSLALVYNGKGVIHRTFNFKEDSIADIVKSLFPDIKYEDFLYQKTKTSSTGILSLIRKELINEIIQKLEKKKVHVLTLTVGPFITAEFFKLLNQYPQDIIYDYYTFKTNSSGDVVDYTIHPEKINASILLSDEKIQSEYVNAYSAACISLLAGTDNFSYSNVADPIIDIQIKKYKEFILKKRGGLVFLVSILIVLLLNFWIFSNLRKENIYAQDQLAVSQSKLKRLDSLESFIKEKKDFLGKAGWIEKDILSKECDEISGTVPAEIKLTELTIHPINVAESRNAKETIFSNRKIIIKGLTKKVESLNDWLKVLSQKTSIKKLHMEEYHFDTQTREGQFKLEGEIN
jgi:Tfp pilus assembly protein PilN